MFQKIGVFTLSWLCWHHCWTNIHNLSDIFAWVCLLARCYTVLIQQYLLESVISHPSFKLHKMIARYVTHISDELEPNKGVWYGQIGQAHVLFITNYVKYITYFKESTLPNWSHTFLYNSKYLYAKLVMRYPPKKPDMRKLFTTWPQDDLEIVVVGLVKYRY